MPNGQWFLLPADAIPPRCQPVSRYSRAGPVTPLLSQARHLA